MNSGDSESRCKRISALQVKTEGLDMKDNKRLAYRCCLFKE